MAVQRGEGMQSLITRFLKIENKYELVAVGYHFFPY